MRDRRYRYVDTYVLIIIILPFSFIFFFHEFYWLHQGVIHKKSGVQIPKHFLRIFIQFWRGNYIIRIRFSEFVRV